MKIAKTHAEIIAKRAKQTGFSVTQLKTSTVHKNCWIQKNGKSFLVNNRVFYPDVPRWQHEVMGSKLLSEIWLKKLSYSKIKSVLFHTKNFKTKKSIEAGLQTFKNYPIIIKPEIGLQARGISIAYTEKQGVDAVYKLLQNKQNVIVQEILMKPEYRILVVNNEVMVMHSKCYPTIAGDGRRTIDQLLKEVPGNWQHADVVRNSCKENKLKLTDVLPTGEQLVCHLAQKGDARYYNSTNIPAAIKKYIKQLCKDTGSPTIGMDIFIDGTPEHPTKFTIIELNSNPGFRYLADKYKDPGVVDRIVDRILKPYT